MLETVKIIIYFIFVLLFYYIVNFELFDYKNFYEFDYCYSFLLGCLPYYFFKYLQGMTNKSIYEYPAKFALLMLATWYILYGILVEEVILKSYSLALLLVGGASLSILTKNNWPYKTDDGMLYKLKNIKYCNLLGCLNLLVMLLVFYVIYIGEWGV